jgi:Icc-related predicted phosphoesterase
LIAGDVCPDFLSRNPGYDAYHQVLPGRGQDKQARWLRETFNPWVDEIPARFVVGIAGNHDFVFENRNFMPRVNWVYLEDNACEVMGVRIHGTPWVPNLPFWAFYGSENALGAAYELVQPCDVLLTHGPPCGAGDLAPRGKSSGEHVGSEACRAAVQRTKPPIVVCGHIHEGYGKHAVQVSALRGLGSTVYNVAHNDGGYNPVNPPVVIDL